jgi:hypothetical protein
MQNHQSQKLQNYAGLADSIRILLQDTNTFEGSIIDIQRVRYLNSSKHTITVNLSQAMYFNLLYVQFDTNCLAEYHKKIQDKIRISIKMASILC